MIKKSRSMAKISLSASQIGLVNYSGFLILGDVNPTARLIKITMYT